jgi:hypothetical protein
MTERKIARSAIVLVEPGSLLDTCRGIVVDLRCGPILISSLAHDHFLCISVLLERGLALDTGRPDAV